MMVVSVLKRTSWCRTFVLGFAGSVATAIATYGATLRCAPYINVLLKDTSCMGYPEHDHLNSRNGQTGLDILNLD